MKKILVVGFYPHKIKINDRPAQLQTSSSQFIAGELKNTLRKFEPDCHLLGDIPNNEQWQHATAAVEVDHDAVAIFCTHPPRTTIGIYSHIFNPVTFEKWSGWIADKLLLISEQTTADIEKLVAKMLVQGIPAAKIATTPPQCSCTDFALLAQAQIKSRNLQIPIALIHLPILPEEVCQNRLFADNPSMDKFLLLRAAESICENI